MSIAIMVHGGAGKIAAERHAEAKAGCREAVLVGWRILERGGSALDAVEATAKLLEDNPNYNAGTGSILSKEGRIEMDAGIMEGHTLNVGAIAGVELIKNPISLARKVLESQHAFLIAAGAQHFAVEHGIPLCKKEELITERQYAKWLRATTEAKEEAEQEPRYYRREVGTVAAHQISTEEKEAMLQEYLSIEGEPRYHRREVASHTPSDHSTENGTEDKHGTVGVVAIDMQGHLAAGTSTGGIANKYPGRVGDSALVGCGFYADEHAAVSCTGYGEDFIRLLIAKRAASFIERGATAREAAEATIALLSSKAKGTGGLIVVDRHGNSGLSWNSEHMVYAYMGQGITEPMVGV